ncbi:hypothetical protein GW17_00050677 [Ensete ventricosum]|nr:hypothetical protein GW17_00050677 [Ensete ventricosum]
MCDTDDYQSNCVDRYKRAHGLPAITTVSSTTTGTPTQSIRVIPLGSDSSPTCPLCRGYVTGLVIVDELRAYLNMKKRCCEEKQCKYVGSYMELQQHAKQEHPHSRPSEVDPDRQQDWENFQRSSEMIDVLSIIDSEMPHGVLFGDYVIEYGAESSDEFDDFPGDDGNWWTSCILYHVFDNFRSTIDRQRLRSEETRRVQARSFYDAHMDDGSTSAGDMPPENHFDGSDEEFGEADDGAAAAAAASRGSQSHRR